jgi:hypothetical protein
MRKTLHEGKFYMSKGLENKDLFLENQIQKKKEEEQAEEARKLLMEAEKAKQEELEKKLEKLEMLPLGSKVILLPYPTNPYRKVLHGNIFVDYTGAFDNPDTGEKDTLEQGIVCAKVIEVGPSTQFVQAGDDVYVDRRTLLPVPFMSLGYMVAVETNIISTINEGLTERFKQWTK